MFVGWGILEMQFPNIAVSALLWFWRLHPTLMVQIGTAGWSLPAKPTGEGTHLYHYSRALTCAEINSTFYRMPRATTWAKWCATTPRGFRFSIKAPKAITHEAKLRNSEQLLKSFLEQIKPVGDKLGPVLFQLPPSLAFDQALGTDFFLALRTHFKGPAVLEPRHCTWFTSVANTLLTDQKISRAAVDPPKGSIESASPGGDTDLVYYRLHGSPHTYYSSYEESFLVDLAARVAPCPNVWITFDNTAQSHAYSNALRLGQIIASLSG
jgi:uncharacterized protein YecE (DUF72 family)